MLREEDLVKWQRQIQAQVQRRRDAEVTIERYVAILRRMGATWSEVATCLGVSAQGARQRYGKDRL